MLALFVALSLAHAGEPLLVDPGGPHGATLPGFLRVWDGGSDDPTRVAFRHPPARTAPTDLLDPLLDATEGGVLALTLPPGPHVAWLLLDEDQPPLLAWARRDGITVTVHGTDHVVRAPFDDVDAFLASPAYGRAWRPRFDTAWGWDRTRAGQGWVRVDLTAESGHPTLLSVQGAAVGALALVAADDPQADTLPDAIDDRRRAEVTSRVPPQPLPAGADPSTPTGWEVRTWAAPPTGTVVRRSTHHVAPGSTLRLTALLHGRHRDAVPVTIDAPAGWGVEASEVTWLDAAGAPDRPRIPRALLPWPLEDGRLEGGQGLPPVLGLALEIPADARPGRHRVQVVARPVDAPAVRLTLLVEVHDVRLPPPPVPTGVSLPPDPVLAARLGPVHPRTLAWMDDALDLLAHRDLAALALRRGWWPRPAPGPGDPVDTTMIRRVLQGWADRGGEHLIWSDPKIRLRIFAFYRDHGPVLPPPWRPVVTEVLSVLEDAPLDVLVTLYEEEGWKHAGVLDRARRLAEAVRPLAPEGLELGATVGHPLADGLADTYDHLRLGDAPTLRKARVDAVRGDGARVSVYNLAAGRTGPLTAWCVGADTYLQWTFLGIDGDPTQLVRSRGPWFFGFTRPDGTPAPTAWLERLATGVTDTRWMAGLAEAIGRLPPDHPDVRRARALIDRTCAALDGAVDTQAFDGERLPDAALQALRAEVAPLLARLQSE